MYKEIIEYLANKIKRCDEFGGMEKEKWAFQTTLKEVRKLSEQHESIETLVKQQIGNDSITDAMNDIDSVASGWGEASTFIRVGNKFNGRKITRIEKTEKVLGKGYYNDLTIDCYIAYDENDKPIVAINEGINVEVRYCL